jgi:hypothetical protein
VPGPRNHPARQSTYLSYIKAGIRFAATPRLVKDCRGIDREVSCSGDPHVADSEARVTEVTCATKVAAYAADSSDNELAAILGEIRDDWTFNYCIMALAVGVRGDL